MKKLLNQNRFEGAVLTHIGVAIICGSCQSLLDRARRNPPQHILNATGFVICARGSAPAERLLPDYCACRFVVDIEVPGGVAESALSQYNRFPVGSEDRPGQAVSRSRIKQLQRLFKFAVRINKYSHHRAKNLL